MPVKKKIISNTNNRYTITSNGVVFDCQNKKEIKQWTNCKNGYRYVRIFILGRPKTVSVHRITATEFIPNQENKKCVNHKNGIKTDNRLCNLEWITHSENNIHAFKSGLKTMSNFQVDMFRKMLRTKVRDVNTNKIYDSIQEACKELNIEYKVTTLRLARHKHHLTPLRYVNE